MTLIEVMVVIFVTALLAAMFLPALAAAKRRSGINCTNNLKQIGLAFRIWEGDNGDKYPMQLALTNSDAMKLIGGGNAYFLCQSISNELGTPKILICPEDKNHIAATNFVIGFSDANISYFFGLDVTPSEPQMILAGDDNFTVGGVPVQPGILNLQTNNLVAWTKERHHGAGNIGLADGSVQQTTSIGLSSALVSSGTATNRLVIP
jgi:hypothetical protein